MISHQVLTRSDVGTGTLNAIESYYADAKDDYYAKDNQPSAWQGKLAEELGLTGEVEKKDFIKLMSGISPDHKELRQNKYKNKDANERLAIDLTFSAPKSISIESLVNGNIDVLKAHEDAVTRTLELIEKRANTRLKKDGVSQTVNTANLAIGKFRHETNRNNDPHLHTHAVILNITKREDGEFRALHNDSIIKSTKEFTKIYQGFLAKTLKEQGFKIRVTKDGFELAHINDQQIKAFSSRSKEVEKALAAEGLTRETASTADKQKAALSTRQRKTEKDIIQTRNQWAKDAKKFGIKPFAVNKTIVITPTQKTLDAFDNAFNKQHDIQQPHDQLKHTENLHEPTRHDPRQFDFTRNTNRVEADRGTDFTRGLAEFIENSRANNIKGFNQERIVTGDQKQSDQQSLNQDSRYFYNREIQQNGAEKSAISSARHSFTDFGKSHSERTESFSYSVRTMSSIPMADPNGFNKLLLPVDQEVFFHNERTDFIAGLSRGTDSSRSDAGSITQVDQDKNAESESLDDIFTYHLIDESMRQKWHDKLEPITEADINNEVLLFESKEQLKEFVIDHLTDKNNIIYKKDLEKQLIDKGLGLVSYDDIEQLINDMVADKRLLETDQLYNLNGELLTEKGIINKLELPEGNYNLEKILANNKIEKLETVYTTPEAYERDKFILSMLDYAKGQNSAAYTSDQAKILLEKTTLNDGQKRSAEMVLTSTDSIIGIQGYAGTGKSYMLAQTKEILEQSGKEMHFFAPYASQVKSLEKDGLEAHTLAKFLKSPSLQKDLNENSVLVIDESGVINSKQMKELLALRQAIGCQVVLLGDTAQTKAIEAGSPFELLQQNGLKIEKMTDIQRQKKEDLKEAVVLAVNDKMGESVKNLKNLYEIENTEKRHDEIVTTYMSLSNEDRANTLIVAGTNADRSSINEKVREQLGIKGQGIEFKALNNIDLSDAEKKLTHFYEVGNIVKFGKDNKKSGIEKDIPYSVIEINQLKNKLILKDPNNNVIEVNPKGKDISAYKEVDIEMSKGDKIRITKTEKSKELATGDLFEIESISKDTGTVIGKDTSGKLHTFKVDEKHHITHAYAMTVHASQGLTYNNVIADLNTKSLTLSKETFYVAISRAKFNAYVFTEDKNQLPEAVLRSSSKSNAVSLFNDNVMIKGDIILSDSIKDQVNNTKDRGDKMESNNLDNNRTYTVFLGEDYTKHTDINSALKEMKMYDEIESEDDKTAPQLAINYDENKPIYTGQYDTFISIENNQIILGDSSFELTESEREQIVGFTIENDMTLKEGSGIEQDSSLYSSFEDLFSKDERNPNINLKQYRTISALYLSRAENDEIRSSDVSVNENNISFAMYHNQIGGSHSIDINKDGSVSVMDSEDRAKHYLPQEVDSVMSDIAKNIENISRVEEAKSSLEQHLKEAGYNVYEQTKIADDQVLGDVEYQVLVAENADNTYVIYHGFDKNNELTFDLESQRFTSAHRERHTFTISESEAKNGFELKPENFKYHLASKESVNAVEDKHFTNNINDLEFSKINYKPLSFDLSFKAEGKEIYSRTSDIANDKVILKADDTSDFHAKYPHVIEKFTKDHSPYYKVELQSSIDNQLSTHNKTNELSKGKSKQDSLEM